MAEFETIEVSRTNGLATVYLNRPVVHNALNAQMIAEITEAVTELSRNSSIRVVVMRGRGKSFSAGADVNWMRASLDFSTEQNTHDAELLSDMFQAINVVNKPVVTVVHGAALGGGMGLMAVSDIVIAAGDAIFGFTESKLGIIPSVISRFVVPKIGESWARALFLTGERFDAEVARHIGLVHWIVPRSEVETTVADKVNELLGAGPSAVTEAKQLVRDVKDSEPSSLRELTAKRIAAIRTSPEGQEGLRAFLEKRQPSWKSDPH